MASQNRNFVVPYPKDRLIQRVMVNDVHHIKTIEAYYES